MTTRTTTSARRLIVCSAAAVVLAACGGSDDVATPAADGGVEEPAGEPAPTADGNDAAETPTPELSGGFDPNSVCDLVSTATIEAAYGYSPEPSAAPVALPYAGNCNYDNAAGGVRLRVSVVDFDHPDAIGSATENLTSNLAFAEDAALDGVGTVGGVDGADGDVHVYRLGQDAQVDYVTGNRFVSLTVEGLGDTQNPYRSVIAEIAANLG